MSEKKEPKKDLHDLLNILQEDLWRLVRSSANNDRKEQKPYEIN